LAQFREVEQFSKFGSELDPTTRKLLLRSKAMIEVLKQERNKPINIYRQLIIFYLSSTKEFEDAINSGVVVDMSAYVKSLLFFIKVSAIFLPYDNTLEQKAKIDTDLYSILLKAHARWFFLRADFDSDEKIMGNIFLKDNAVAFQLAIVAMVTVEDFFSKN